MTRRGKSAGGPAIGFEHTKKLGVPVVFVIDDEVSVGIDVRKAN